MRRALAGLVAVVCACSAPPIDDRLSTDGVSAPADGTPSSDAGPSSNNNGGSDGAANQQAQTFTLTVNLTGGTGTVASQPAGVSCTGTSCTGTFPKGTAVTLTATPAAGVVFVAWSGGCTGTAACAPTMDKDVTVGAELTGLDGTWTGTYTNTRPANGCTFNNAGNLTINATGSGTAISHASNVTGLEIRQIPGCALVQTSNGSSSAKAVTVTGTTITGTWTMNVQGVGGTLDFPFTATVTGKTMKGTWTCASCAGGFTVTKP